MPKCVYCSCTATIEPGKGYCNQCGHDAVAHVNAGAGSAGIARLLKLIIAAAAALTVFFLMKSGPDAGSSSAPASAAAPQPPPAAAPTAPAGNDVVVLPPPTVQPNGQILPAAPPLGSWQSNPGK